MNIFQAIVYFALISILGYIYETTFCSIRDGKWTNRGFLFGPVIPIYGVGALFGTICYDLFNFNLISFVIFSIIVSAILEYFTHYFLEKLFHAYWWDYHDLPLNINGRICIFFSICFGLGGTFIIYVLNPLLIPRIVSFDQNFINVLSLFIVSLFSIDTTLTVNVLTNFEEKIMELNDSFNYKMEGIFETLEEKIPNIVLFKPKFLYAKSTLNRIKGFKIANIKDSSLINSLNKKKEELFFSNKKR